VPTVTAESRTQAVHRMHEATKSRPLPDASFERLVVGHPAPERHDWRATKRDSSFFDPHIAQPVRTVSE
jgi:hypothetical protein